METGQKTVRGVSKALDAQVLKLLPDVRAPGLEEAYILICFQPTFNKFALQNCQP